MTARLGVDIGGVIIERTDESDDTSFWGDNYLATPAVAGVFEALRSLRDDRFRDDLYVVSKSGTYTEWRAREWLEHHDFYGRTGIRRGNVHFCRRRRDKAGIARELGLTQFVDDHLEVLLLLRDVPHRYLLGGKPDEEVPIGVTRAPTWRDATQAIFVDGL
jgi:hypothetical protein